MSKKSLDEMIKDEVVKWDCYKNAKLCELIYEEFTKSQRSRNSKKSKKVNKQIRKTK